MSPWFDSRHVLVLASVCLALFANAARVERETCPEKYRQYEDTYAGKHIRCYDDDPDAQTVTLTQELKDALVKKHNDLRGSVSPSSSNMQAMVWDDTLAETARKWAMQCEPYHSRNHLEPDYPHLAVSQNAARIHKDASEGIEKDFPGAVQAWFDEVNLGIYTYGEPYTKKGAGHYLTMVHALSNRVGCGAAYCPTKWNDRDYYAQRHYFHICNYAYGNNFTLPYNSGKPCEECPGNCDDGGKLCDCKGLLCFNNGAVDLKTCTCKCDPDFYEGKFGGTNCNERICPESQPRYCDTWKDANCNQQVWMKKTCPKTCGLCP